MDIKQAEKITKYFNRIKKLDEEIITIEKQAMLIANEKTEIKFSLDIEDLSAKDNEENKVKFDEDGSLINQNYNSPFQFQWVTMHPLLAHQNESKNTTAIKQELKPGIALNILQIILSEKLSEREYLINHIDKCIKV